LPTTVHVEADQKTSPRLTGAYPPGWVDRPRAEIEDSWQRQVTLVQQQGVTVRLQARLAADCWGGVSGDQYARRPEDSWPLTRPLLIIGAVPGPSEISGEQAEGLRAELLRQLGLLAQLGLASVPAMTVDRGHAWVEPSVIVIGPAVDADEHWQVPALDVALRLGIDTVVRVSDGVWQVLSVAEESAASPDVRWSGSCSITVDREHRCPMQQAPVDGQYCRMHGGPWTSSSIHAAASWREHRDMLIDAAGCDTCEGARYRLHDTVYSGGGPISLAHSPIPTRWLTASGVPSNRGAVHEHT